MIEIDGSKGEGGGQMIRTSVALSVLTGKPIKLTRIRENRPTTGLSKQHTAAVEAVAMMSDSIVRGNYIGSNTMTFSPGSKQTPTYDFDITTAGSISLALQAVLLSCVRYKEEIRLEIKGGTNVMWAPPIDLYDMVLFPMMRRMGIDASSEIIKRGFFPSGGGHVKVDMDPIMDIKPLDLSNVGKLKSIVGRCYVQNLNEGIGRDMINTSSEVLKDELGIDMQVEVSKTGSKGAGMVLVANYENSILSSNILSSKNVTAEQTGRMVAEELLQEMRSGSTLDVQTADQLLPYMALANGKSEFIVSRISRHLLSQMDTLESFLDVRFGVERKDDGYHFTVSPEERP